MELIKFLHQISPPGVVVEVNVVIMFHKLVLTKVDRSLKIECLYMQAEKTVSNSFDVRYKK